MIKLLIFLSLFGLLFSCEQNSDESTTLSGGAPVDHVPAFKAPKVKGWRKILQKGEITFLTMNTSTSYIQGKDGEPEGFEYELARAFADEHKLKAKFTILDSIDEILEQLSLGKGDLAVAGITKTEKRVKSFGFGPTYNKVFQSVACRKNFKIKKTKELKKLKLVIPSKTSYEETLLFLKGLDSELTWKTEEDNNSEALLQKVWKDKSLCTIVDSHILDLHRRYLPELKQVFKFQKVDELGWAFIKSNTTLSHKLDTWFAKKDVKTKVADLKRKHFEFIEFDAYNLKVFNKRIKSRLPKYIKHFKKAAKEVNLPWQLLAAVGYQESFWNPKAVSPTGVRGIMMLTRKTAKEMKVKKRTDPEQSIFGGAKYLRKLINRLPSYLHEEDRTWFALASYNVGYYHLRDALALSIWQNKNPTRWHTVSEVLPLLSQKKFYRRLPYGHARGLEPVIYVKRIKDFYDILRKKTENIKTVKI